MLLVFVLILCVSSVSVTRAADTSCNFFQRYVLWGQECTDTNDSDEYVDTDSAVEPDCNFFNKYFLWKDECFEIQARSSNELQRLDKPCTYFQRYILREECNDIPNSYNPDEYLDVPNIIARHGYPSETHVVVTKDGYLLNVHRIPQTKGSYGPKQPIFLQHGLLGSSADWIINGNNSLAFLLADQGYDVWLGNVRGNTYSRGHISLPIDHPTFWNFSFQEMGTQDLSSVITYIAKHTNKAGEIIYIGHSMGTTMFYVFASENPSTAKNIKVMVGMASAGYMTHIQSPIRYLVGWTEELEWLRLNFGFNQFLPGNSLMKALSKQCTLFNIEREICENLIFTLCGYNEEEFNTDILSVLLKKDPAGTSTKTIIHFAQEVRDSGNFQKYDYGSKGNMIEYGQKKPPMYEISKIKNPVYLMYGMNDWLSSYVDVVRFAKQLPNLVGLYKVKMESFNHIDYLFGKDAEELVYQPLIEFLGNYTEY